MDEVSKNKSVEGKSDQGVVQHHEIGELTQFLSTFGTSKDAAVKTLMASSLQIIGLDEVKKKYKTHWNAIQKRVDFAVEAFFTKKLSKDDLFLRLDEGRFALIFANVSQAKGLERANKLANELLQLLFGEMPEAHMISVTAMALDIDLVTVIDEFENLEELVEYLKRLGNDADDDVELQFKEEQEPTLTIGYRPMINHVKKIMSMMEALPCRIEEDKLITLEAEDLLVSGSVDLRAELDFKVLKDTENALKQLGSVGKKPIVMVSVEFETLAHAYWRLKYAGILKKLPAYSQRHLIINITGVKSGLLNSRVRQILTTINPLVLGFTFGVEAHWNDFHIISDLPVFGVTFTGHNEQDLTWIEELVGRAAIADMRTCWRDLTRDDLVRRAFAIGVDFVSGPVIGAIQLDPLTPFSLKGTLGP